MRRSDREITDFQELITVMRGCDVCRLALHDEPYPYILPLNFGLEVDGETVRLYFHGANTGTTRTRSARCACSWRSIVRRTFRIRRPSFPQRPSCA